MASSAGVAYVQIRGDLSDLNKQLVANLSPARLGRMGKVAGVGIGAGLAAGFAGKGLFDLGKTFDTEFDKIRVGTGKTGKALEGLKQDFKEIGKDTPSGFGEIGTAVTELNQRLGLTGKPLQDFAKQMLNLSRITKTDLSTNIAAVAKAFEDWEVPVKDQTEALDGFFRLFQKSGVPVAELTGLVQKFGSPLRILGFTLGQTAATFAGFIRAGVNTQKMIPGLNLAISNLSRPTSGLAATMDKLGISAGNPEEGLKKVFALLGDKSTLSNTEKIGLAMDVFGKRAGADMAEAIRQGRFEVDEMLKVFAGGSDTVNKAAKQTEDFNESWQRLKKRVFIGMEPVATKFFTAISDGMAALATADFGKIGGDISASLELGKIDLGGSGDAIRSSLQSIKSIVNSELAQLIGSVLLGTLKKQLAGIAQIFRSWATVIGETLKLIDDLIHLRLAKAFGDLVQIVKAGVTGTIGILRLMTAPMREIGAQIGRGFSEPIKAAVSGIGGVVSGAFNAVKSVVGTISNAILAVVRSVWPQIATVIKVALAPLKAEFAVFKALAGIARSGLTAVVSAIKSAGGLMAAAAKAAARAMLPPFRSAWSAIKGIFSSGVSAALGALRGMVGDAGNIAGRAGKAIASGFRSALTGIRSVADDIVGVIKRIPGRLGDIGKGILNALKSGLSGATLIPSFKVKGPGPLPDVTFPAVHLPSFAKGGRLRKELALVGEEGPELAKLPTGKMTMVGLGGPEIRELPVGTRIHSHPETKRKLASVSQTIFQRLVPAAIREPKPLIQSVMQEAAGFRRGGTIRDPDYLRSTVRKRRRKRTPTRAQSRRGDRIAEGQERERQRRDRAATPRLFKPRPGAPVFEQRVPSKREQERGDEIARKQERQRGRKEKRQDKRKRKRLALDDLRLRMGLGGITPYQRKHGETEFETVREVEAPRGILGLPKGSPLSAALETISFSGPAGTVGRSGKAFKALEDVKAAHPGVEFQVSERSEGIVLSLLRVPEDMRKAGKGTAALRDLLTYADRTGKKVALNAEPIGKGPGAKTLQRWYKEHGFVPNKGRNKDFAFRESLIRSPAKKRGVQKFAQGGVVGRSVGNLAEQLGIPAFAKGGKVKKKKDDEAEAAAVKTVGASQFGGPRDPATGHVGKYGDLRGTNSYAELDMGMALGKLPAKHPLRITYGGREVVARKRDIGAGGGSVKGKRRAIDLWYETAKKLRFPFGLDLVKTEPFHREKKKTNGQARKQDQITGMAAGGVMGRTALAVVGEEGPELAELPIGTRIRSHPVSKRMAKQMGIPGFAKGGVVRRVMDKTIRQPVTELLKPVTVGERVIDKQTKKTGTVERVEKRSYRVRYDDSPRSVSVAREQVERVKVPAKAPKFAEDWQPPAKGGDASTGSRRIARSSQLAGVSVTPEEVSAITSKWNVNRAVASIGAAVKDKYPAMQIISGFRAGARTKSGNQSNHSIHAALDLGSRGSLNRRIGTWTRSNFPKGLRGVSEDVLDVDHDPNPPDHADHVHVAAVGSKALAKVMEAGDATGKKKEEEPAKLKHHGRFTLGQMVSLAKRAHFPDPALAAAVGFAESSGNTAARNKSAIEDSRGLWQINVKENANPQYKKWDLSDAYRNVKAAFEVSKGGTYWKPWTMFTNNEYKKYLKAAKAAPLPKGTTKGTPSGSSYAEYLTMMLTEAEGTKSDPKDDIRWINRAMRYYRGVRRRNKKAGNHARATEAQNQINTLQDKKDAIKDELANPEVFDLSSGLAKIGTGPNAFNLGFMADALDQIDLEKANASLTLPPDDDDSAGALARSLQDDIGAASRAATLWEGIHNLTKGVWLTPPTPPPHDAPGRIAMIDQTIAKEKKKKHTDWKRIHKLQEERERLSKPQGGNYVIGTGAQQTEAATNLASARSELKGFQDEIGEKQKTEATEAAEAARTAIIDRLRSLAALAALTPGKDDDVAAVKEAIRQYEIDLNVAQQGTDQGAIADAAEALKGARDDLKSLTNEIASEKINFATAFVDVFKQHASNFRPLQSFAKGGVVRALVGEQGFELAKLPNQKVTLVGGQGPEIRELPIGTRIYPHEESKRRLSESIRVPAFAKGGVMRSETTQVQRGPDIALILARLEAALKNQPPREVNIDARPSFTEVPAEPHAWSRALKYELGAL